MSRFTSEPVARLVALALTLGCTLGAATGCGLTVTKERPTFENLDDYEKQAVDVILEELTAFNAEVEKRTRFSIAPVLDRERIDVSFEGLIVTANIGDEVIHVSVWENLTEAQQKLIQQWFAQPSVEAAANVYRTLFYRFLAVSQGAKQYMYQVLTAEWVYGNRSLFNVERDSIRATLEHYQAVGRQTEMWGFMERTCAPLLAAQEAALGEKFDKYYLRDNLADLANPEAPTGYMYFICRWYKRGLDTYVPLSVELNWIQTLPQLQRDS